MGKQAQENLQNTTSKLKPGAVIIHLESSSGKRKFYKVTEDRTARDFTSYEIEEYLKNEKE